MLTEKCRNQEAMIEEFELREQEYQEVMSETEMLRSQTESMKYDLSFSRPFFPYIVTTDKRRHSQ